MTGHFQRAYVEITNVCNLRCAFCPGTARPPRYMTAAEFAHIARALRPCTDYLYLHVMGEPLLHPELEDILSIAQGEGFRLCLTTNGTLLPRRAPLLLSCAALHKVSVSLHSFEGNDGGDIAPYLEGVWDFAAAASEKGVLCALRLWNDGGDDRRNDEIFASLSQKLGAPLDTIPLDRAGHRRLGGKIFLERGERFDWPHPDGAERDTEFCYALRRQIAVLCDGTVVPCCLDSEGALALGNLHRQTLTEILQTPRAAALYDGFSRRRPAEALCRRCGYAARFTK